MLDYFLPLIVCKNSECDNERKPNMSEIFNGLSDKDYEAICETCGDILWVKDEKKRKEYEKKSQDFTKKHGKISSFQEFKERFFDLVNDFF